MLLVAQVPGERGDLGKKVPQGQRGVGMATYPPPTREDWH